MMTQIPSPELKDLLDRRSPVCDTGEIGPCQQPVISRPDLQHFLQSR
jgi:hypothetical protein